MTRVPAGCSPSVTDGHHSARSGDIYALGVKVRNLSVTGGQNVFETSTALFPPSGSLEYLPSTASATEQKVSRSQVLARAGNDHRNPYASMGDHASTGWVVIGRTAHAGRRSAFGTLGVNGLVASLRPASIRARPRAAFRARSS